jgi:hypothetical protein
MWMPTSGSGFDKLFLYLFTCKVHKKRMISDLIKRICRSLDEHHFPYMISGSIAMNIYAIPRMTRDIDIVIELTEERINEFTGLFPGSYYNKDTILNEIGRQGQFNVIDHETGFKLDFILRKDTEYFRLAFDRRKKFREFDTDLWVISPEDLIIAKILWIQQLQSEKQMDDIRNLLMSPDLDLEYLKPWCKNLKLNTFDLLPDE